MFNECRPREAIERYAGDDYRRVPPPPYAAAIAASRALCASASHCDDRALALSWLDGTE